MNSFETWPEEWAQLNKKEGDVFRGCVERQIRRERVNGWWLKRNLGDNRCVQCQQNLLCSMMLCGVGYFGRGDEVLHLASQ